MKNDQISRIEGFLNSLEHIPIGEGQQALVLQSEYSVIGGGPDNKNCTNYSGGSCALSNGTCINEGVCGTSNGRCVNGNPGQS